MTAVVLYESEFGATRAIAEAVAEGIRSVTAVALQDVRDPGDPLAASIDLLIAGAPTHARSMPTAASRAEAQHWPERAGSILTLEPRADRPGMREWLAAQTLRDVDSVAFATRMAIPLLLSGSAVGALERALRAAGATVRAPGGTFVIDKAGRLLDGERDRAVKWGRGLGLLVAPAPAGRTTRD